MTGSSAVTASPAIVVVGAAAIDEWYAVSNLPERDGGAYANEVTTAFGGVGANVAVALDRLGRDVCLLSRVGDDEYGRQARENLATTGIDMSRVRVGDGSSTRSVILRDPDGRRAIITVGESFRELRLDETDRETIVTADIVFLTAYTPDTVVRSVLDCTDAAVDPPRLVFDLSGAVEELVGRGTEAKTIHRCLHRADLFVAGDVAAEAYFGGRDAAIKRIAAAQRAQIRGRSDADRSDTDGIETDGSADDNGVSDDRPLAALTHGADGMTVVAGGEVSAFEAFEIDPVDTTGAGDAFVAGLIDQWLADETDVAAAVRFAAAVAAINCTARFAQPGLPNRKQAETFLAEHSHDRR